MDDRGVLGLLRELAANKLLDMVDTDPSAARRLKIGSEPNAYGLASVTIFEAGEPRVFMGLRPENWIETAIRMIGIGSERDRRTLELAAHLPTLAAHSQNYRDIFATTVPDLLVFRDKTRRGNVRTLRETLKIVGLYLRSKGDYSYRWLANRGSAAFDRGLFYWVLARHRMPPLWRYCAACLRRGSTMHDDTDHLGNGILVRAVRALQARDEVGYQFYRRQNNTTRDEMLYHFDYLTLMLSGIFDAQARVARLTYDIHRPSVAKTKFRNPAFPEALRASGATELYEVVTAQDFRDFGDVLAGLRNSVHGTALSGMGVSRADDLEQSSVVRIYEDADRIWDAAGRLGMRDAFGISRLLGVVIEPYSCAAQLVDVGFDYINGIAAATDVSRLVPADNDVDLPTGPGDDRVFGGETARRVDALG
jgi:hypothetical protein